MTMSFFTAAKINTQRRESLNLLSSPERIHAAVMKGFPNSEESGERILWSLQKGYASTIVYVESDTRPDYTGWVERYGWPELPPENTVRTTDNTAFHDSISEDDIRVFQLTATPAKKMNGSKNRVPLVGEAANDWVRNKLLDAGCEIIDGTFSKKSENSYKFTKNAGSSVVKVSQSTYAGLVRIKDPKKAVSAINDGIGSNKAYGSGLLLLGKRR